MESMAEGEMSDAGRSWIVVAACVAMVGCRGRRKDVEAYADEMCACKDGKCVVAVDKKWHAKIDAKVTFAEKHLLAQSAEDAIRDAYRRAESCAKPFKAGEDWKCGGEAGEPCPPGFSCEIVDEEISDAQGECIRIPGYDAAKIGKACGGPANIGCEPGATCVEEPSGKEAGTIHVCRAAK